MEGSDSIVENNIIALKMHSSQSWVVVVFHHITVGEFHNDTLSSVPHQNFHHIFSTFVCFFLPQASVNVQFSSFCSDSVQ